MSEITITGNAVEAPAVSYGPQGTPVTSLRLARTERFRDTRGQWVDGDTLFIRVTCWRQLAENVAESVRKGTRVVVTGKLRSHTFKDSRLVVRETGEEADRTVVEIEAADVAISLKHAGVRAERATANGGPGDAPF